MTPKMKHCFQLTVTFGTLIFVASSLIMFFHNRDELFSVSRPMLGTIVSISLYASAADEGGRLASLAFDEIERIENLMSPVRPQSDIYRINNTRSFPVKISNETASLIEDACLVSAATNGAFDVSFVPLGNIWNYKNKNFIPPDVRKIEKAKGLVNYKNIYLNRETSELSLNSGMSIGFGAIAKGYAAKQAMLVLKNAGVGNAIIAVAGDIKVIGRNRWRPWSIGLQHPRKDGILLTIDLDDEECIDTSGDYERFAVYEGKRYHHIIDPRSGRPAESGLVSVSVIGNSPEMTDAWSTAMFILGLEESRKLLKQYPELKGILVDDNLNIYASKSLMEKIHLTEKYFKIVWID